MNAMQTVAPFFRGNIEGYNTLTSIWLRGLEGCEEKLDKWAADLPLEGFWWSPVAGANSVGALTNHIGITALRLAHVAQGWDFPPEIQKTPAEQLVPSGELPEVVIARTKASFAQVRGWLQGVPTQELEVIREWKDRGHAPALHFWHKLVEHSLEHTGQIITLRKLWNAQSA